MKFIFGQAPTLSPSLNCPASWMLKSMNISKILAILEASKPTPQTGHCIIGTIERPPEFCSDSNSNWKNLWTSNLATEECYDRLRSRQNLIIFRQNQALWVKFTLFDSFIQIDDKSYGTDFGCRPRKVNPATYPWKFGQLINPGDKLNIRI